jgi:hypothetical protein
MSILGELKIKGRTWEGESDKGRRVKRGKQVRDQSGLLEMRFYCLQAKSGILRKNEGRNNGGDDEGKSEHDC